MCTNNVHRIYTQIFMLNELGYLIRKITLTLSKELYYFLKETIKEKILNMLLKSNPNSAQTLYHF